MVSSRWLDSFTDNVTPKISGKNRHITNAVTMMYNKTENYRRYKFFSVIFMSIAILKKYKF